jgi:hypothetical protein
LKENDREIFSPSGTEQIQRSLDQLCLMRPLPGAKMNFDDDDIALLLRLKRDEQPPANYYENFLSEFRRRQRDHLLRQPLLSICVERAQNFVLRLDVRSVAPYPAAIAAVLVCGAVVSIRIYQQPEPAQVTLQSSSVPGPRRYTEGELNLAPPVLIPTFNGNPSFLPARRSIRLLPTDRLWSDEIRLKRKWESLDDR